MTIKYQYMYWSLGHGEIEVQEGVDVEPWVRAQLPTGAILHAITRTGRTTDDAIVCEACQEKRNHIDGDIVHPIFRLPAAPSIKVDYDPNDPGPRYA